MKAKYCSQLHLLVDQEPWFSIEGQDSLSYVIVTQYVPFNQIFNQYALLILFCLIDLSDWFSEFQILILNGPKKRSVWHSTVPSPFTHRCAVPTMRPILLCKNSNLKCGMKWPMWRGECYLPPCCNTVAGWAQSPLWYPSFKSRPFSLFVCLFYFRSPSCNTLWVTNSLSPVCCFLEFIAYVLWFGPK